MSSQDLRPFLAAVRIKQDFFANTMNVANTHILIKHFKVKV